MLAPSTLNMFPKFELAPILMYFVMFAKILAAFDYALIKDEQAFFEQDDVGGFLGDVDGGIDRDRRRPRLSRRDRR